MENPVLAITVNQNLFSKTLFLKKKTKCTFGACLKVTSIEGKNTY